MNKMKIIWNENPLRTQVFLDDKEKEEFKEKIKNDFMDDFKDYDDKTREITERLYREDLEFLGYDF
jgi:hypothetical protein